jgi:4-aminobutyrate aminotransferase-like enzyme
MALAQIGELEQRKLIEQSARLGRFLLNLLDSEIANSKLKISVRGSGLLVGMELRRHDGSPATDEALKLIKGMLHAGFILLPEGEHSNVISFTPPLTITEAQLKTTVGALKKALSARD